MGYQMHWIDWVIVFIPIIVVTTIALRTYKYVHGVSDFLAASRVAGRYVVAVANGEAALGLIAVVAAMEMYVKVGFAVGFWANLVTPISMVILLTGFVIYRYRETRAMTLAQFFEIRYSKRFRVFAGVMQAISGIVNYSLFPAVGARFFVYFCDLPAQIEFLGLQWPTFGLLMALFLSIAVVLTTLGGQITVMTTDCVQGILSYPMYMIVAVTLMVLFSWNDQVVPTMLDRPPGESMLNPFDTVKLQDFNLFYVLVGIVSAVYNINSWSGTQGYNAAAATPHEQKMGRILGTWRGGFSSLMLILLAVASYVYLHHADFDTRAAATESRLDWKALNDIHPQPDYQNRIVLEPTIIEERVAQLSEKETQVYATISNQMRVPVVLSDILPVGVTGVFCALMVFLMVSTDTTYMHSWGSILIQDIVLPCRKKPFTPRQQLWLLRVAIAGVALFAFFFSLYFGQVTYILMFFALTGSIWLGGAGAVILGGLYWKKGTTAGAWAALLTGSGLALLGFIGQQYWVDWIYPAIASMPGLLDTVKWVIEGISGPFEPVIRWRVTPESFPINGQEVYFLTMIFAIVAYIAVSLATCRENFNMDRMLHRGQYRRDEVYAEKTLKEIKPPRSVKEFLRVMLGIDDQFTRGDRILSWSVFIYGIGWMFGSWLFALVWNLIDPWSDMGWAGYFLVTNIIISALVGIVSTVWFTIGGAWDLNRMFKRLATQDRNLLDDGRVLGHINTEDLAFIPESDMDQQADEDKVEEALRNH